MLLCCILVQKDRKLLSWSCLCGLTLVHIVILYTMSCIDLLFNQKT